jgi:phospholipid/cholesterol/gamma-HCH transport system ATP-binding protein
MTTVVITHDMNSVMEIGDSVLYIHQGKKWWEGDKNSIITDNNPEVEAFVYASSFMKEIRTQIQQKRSL